MIIVYGVESNGKGYYHRWTADMLPAFADFHYPTWIVPGTVDDNFNPIEE